jgi:hypothetical protein
MDLDTIASFNGYAQVYRFDVWPFYGSIVFTVYISVSCKLLSCDYCLTPFIFIVFTGESTINVVAVHSTLHLPFDHRMYGQNLTVQVRKEIMALVELCFLLSFLFFS